MKVAELRQFAKEQKLMLGARYQRFVVSSEAQAYQGRALDGLPNSEFGSRWPIRFVSPSAKLLTEQRVAPQERRCRVPLAAVKGEADFFVVDVRGDAPVLFWNHEDRRMVPFTPSLDGFLARLLRKQDKTLLQQLRAALKPGLAAVRAKKYEQALAAVGTLPRELEAFSHVRDHDDVAELLNLYGMALQGVGKHADARAAFQRAVQHGSDAALLNLMASHLDARDHAKVIALGQHAAVLDTEHAYWLMRYLVAAYLATGRLAEAERELKSIHGAHATSKERMAEARRWLESLARGKSASAVKRYLEWFVHVQKPAKTPAKAKPALPTADELLARGEGRSACQQFGSDGQGTVAVALDDGAVLQVTAFLMPGEDGASIRRGDRLRLVKTQRKWGSKFLFVAKGQAR